MRKERMKKKIMKKGTDGEGEEDEEGIERNRKE
jgi:hypothetical protein